jgi:hypothetical protein
MATAGGGGMSQHEFMSFIFDCRITLKKYVPATLFLDTALGNPAVSKERAKAASLDRAKFIDAICLLAGAVYEGVGDGPPPSLFALPRVIKSSQVEKLLKNHVLPMAGRISSSTAVRQELVTPAVAMLLVKEKEALDRLFYDFADAEDDGDSGDEGSDDGAGGGGTEARSAAGSDDGPEMVMTMGGFLHMLGTCGLLNELPGAQPGHRGKTKQEANYLSLKAAYMAFVLAQSEDEDEAGGDSDGEGGDSGIEELDSAEYIEAMAHIANSKFGDEAGTTLADRFNLMLAVIQAYYDRCAEEGIKPGIDREMTGDGDSSDDE